MKFREIELSSGTKIFLGKNAENNDELVEMFKGKENVIMHTVNPGSPFCVIKKLNPEKEEIKETAVFCAKYSQDWRDNKKDVKIHVFTGKEIKKPFFAKVGTWKITDKAKVINVKKEEILKLEKK
jgi:predicted ribosome quality control (RQC) complex YloA/Tae2 family protein